MANESTVQDIHGMAFDEAPPPRSDKAPRTASAPPRKTSTKELEQGLEEIFGLYSLYLQMAKGDDFCATYVLENCEAPARAWAKLAEKNPTVNRILSVIIGEPGAWAEVFMATVGFAMPMLAHHGRVPIQSAQLFNNVEIPEVIQPQPSRIFKRKKARPNPRPAGTTEERASAVVAEAVASADDPTANGWSGVPVEAESNGPH